MTLAAFARELKPGAHVRIVGGALRGHAGVVVQRCTYDWARSIPLYDLKLADGDPQVRTIRADYLESE